MEVPTAVKRLRLSMACNECKRRKVKCDADYPKCRNCRLRDDRCITTDAKRPGCSVMREWIDQSDIQNFGQGKGAASTTDAQDNNENQPSVAAKALTPPATENTAGAGTPATTGISPVHQRYEMSFNLDTSSNRIKMLGASSSQCLTKSLDMYLMSTRIEPVSNVFRHGMRHVEEMSLHVAGSTAKFPDLGTRTEYLDTFFGRIHPLFPLFDIDAFRISVHRFASLPDLHSLSHEQLPVLASAYLVMSMGADELAQQPTSDGDIYLTAAVRFLGHIILIPYLSSVQALLLFTIAFRGRSKDGVGWQTLGMAVRVAHTLGLHQHSAVRPSSQHGVQHKHEQLFHARIWAICCCLEKLMQLQSGRPSSIEDVNCDQMMGRDQRAPGHDFLQWNMGLAEHFGHISSHIYGHKPGSRTARQILLDTGRLDRSLLTWASRIPMEFRPGHDLFCSNEEFHIAAYLSIHYHEAMITLHRAALIAPSASFEAEVAAQCPDDPSQFRIRGGSAICVNSARSIARLSSELAERKAESRIMNPGPTLLACIVLAIHLMKNPAGGMRAADVELLKSCAEYTADHYLKCGQDPSFAQGAITIHDRVRLYVENTIRKASKKRKGIGKGPVDGPIHVNDQPIGSNLDQSHRNRSTSSGPPTYQQIFNPHGLNSIVPNGSIQTSITLDHTLWTRQHHPDPTSQVLLPSYLNDDQASGLQPISSIDPRAENNIDSNSSEDALTQTGNLPFDGLNVEDLWNWMLVLDSEGASTAQNW